MGIDLNGEFVVIEAEIGPNGRANFEDAVRAKLGLDACIPLDFSFKCKAPDGSACLS